MYDFYFGDKKKILSQPEEFLIFCKRMLPRWLNGIPDSEYLEIWNTLKCIKEKKPVVIETGSGASSIVLFFYSVINEGKLFTWDTNGSKGFELKSIISEIICKPLKVNIHDHWNFVSFNSTDKNIGIEVLNELKLKASFGFFDSLHTLDNLLNEIECFLNVASNCSYIAIDDSYYTKKKYNFSFVNMIRKKMNLSEIKEPLDNICEPYYIEVEKYLKNKKYEVSKIKDNYKENYKNDIFFKYFNIDRNIMNEIGMEKLDLSQHRFDAWEVKINNQE